MNQFSNKYDLEERTALFAEKIIESARTIKQDAVNKRIIEQLIGSAGLVGANYCEATEAESKKDFIHKIGIVKKELKKLGIGCVYWLILIQKEKMKSGSFRKKRMSFY